MLTAQIYRNLHNNQSASIHTLTVRPELFFTEIELTPQTEEPHDIFIPRDPCQNAPLPDIRAGILPAMI